MLEGYTMDQVRVLLDELLAVSVIVGGILAVVMLLRCAYLIITEDDKKEDKESKDNK